MTTYRGKTVARIDRDIYNQTIIIIGEDGTVLDEIDERAFYSFPQLRKVPHGRHRKTRPPVYSSAVGAPYFSLSPRAVNQSRAASWVAWPAEPNPPIENAGIRAGEVTGLRAWRICGDRLFSVYINTEWKPDEPMRGDSKIAAKGVHAFKSRVSLDCYLMTKDVEAAMEAMMERVLGVDRGTLRPIFAIGTVNLWGEVVEHEHGWRAEFGKVASLDEIRGSAGHHLLDELRARYGVA